ncbi:hypothetical protein HK100_004847, partial [Physocladia obscura]
YETEAAEFADLDLVWGCWDKVMQHEIGNDGGTGNDNGINKETSNSQGLFGWLTFSLGFFESVDSDDGDLNDGGWHVVGYGELVECG